MKLRGRPPIWRGGPRAYFCAIGLNPHCFEHGGSVNVSMEEVLFFCSANLDRTRVGRITSGTSALGVVSGFLSCLCLTPFLCFR